MISPLTGLIALRLDGEPIRFPRFERTGRLWLGTCAAATATAQDSLGLSAYRRIKDDNPLRVITRLDLDVTGRAREIGLDAILLPGGIPLRLDSPLPARLEPAGRLRLQVRPGHWKLEITAYHPGPITELMLAAVDPPWPSQKVWVFSRVPPSASGGADRRGAGGLAADPAAGKWARLPAYLMRLGGTLRLVQNRRGNVEFTLDRLSLERDLWLDFGGAGYTLQDRITGELTRSRRLEVEDALDLGQVLVAGEPQFITQVPNSIRGEGVEVRPGRIELMADSRIEDGARSLPASRMAIGFPGAAPPAAPTARLGLLAVSGVDNLPDTWLYRWTLLDLFLVLVIALVAAQLWGWPWSVLALAAIVLWWQELGAPQLIWINLLAVAALLCLIPAQPARTSMARLRFWLQLYQRGSLLLLAVLLLPFLVEDVRTGLYPQLGPSKSGFGEEPGLTVLDSMEGPEQEMPMETDLAMGESLKEPLAVASFCAPDIGRTPFRVSRTMATLRSLLIAFRPAPISPS